MQINMNTNYNYMFRNCNFFNVLKENIETNIDRGRVLNDDNNNNIK